MHHKAMSDDTSSFRCAVEAYRIVQDVNLYATNHPDERNLVVMGDMNDDYTRTNQPVSFASAPSGLPSSYELGADITFPVAYRVYPLARYTNAATKLVRLPACQGTTTNRITYPPDHSGSSTTRG